MNSDNTYCRLCAENKPSNMQLDLQIDLEKRNEITQKLIRINAPIEFSDNKLPSTVCRACVSSMDICFYFVRNIEYVQNFLINIQQNVKNGLDLDEDQTFHVSFIQNSLPDDETPLAKIIHKDSRDQLKHEHYDMKLESDKDNTSKVRDISVHSDGASLVPTNIDDIQIKTECTEQILQGAVQASTQTNVQNNASSEWKPLPQPMQTWADYNWRCTFCESLFLTINELHTHSREAHSACNPYRCTDCNFRKGRLDKFLVHVRTHHKDFKYSCYKCLMKFKSTVDVRQHHVSHVRTKFRCPGCKATFTNSIQLKLHTDTYYNVKKKVLELPQLASLTEGLTCKQCSKTFKTKGNLKSHVICMHSERKKTCVCEECGKAWYSRTSLAQHMLTHRDDRPFECHICKLAFKTAPVLAVHIERHNNARPFSCDKCGSDFRLLRDLAQHRAVHLDALPFRCSLCEKRFKRKRYLSNHERVHSGETPYSCAVCQHAFANWPNYNKHMKQRHNIDTSKRKSPPK